MQVATTPNSPHPGVSRPTRSYSTEEAAAVLKVLPNTLRSALSRDGHYFGLRPKKARNRFLIWDAVEVDALLSGEGV
jgi:hypothetical protein